MGGHATARVVYLLALSAGPVYRTPVRTHLAAEARVGGLLVHPVLRQQLALLVRGRLLVLHLVDPGGGNLDVAEVALRACRRRRREGGLVL